MKKFYLFFALLLYFFSITHAKQQLNTNNQKDSVIKQNPGISSMMFVPGELLIKFRDNVKVNLSIKGNKVQTGISMIDQVLVQNNVTTIEKLFPNEKQLKTKTIIKAYNGNIFERPSLHNIYKLKFSQTQNMYSIIDELKRDSLNIEYAEPNYIISVMDYKTLSPILTEKELTEYRQLNKNAKSSSSTVNDPLYSQQLYIPEVHANEVWDSIKGKDTTQIIAILDTGVDWLHPDLTNKIWTNTDEIPNNGIDDDGNGKTDDIRGWDWINNDNNPMDDNSHGTHVAGIAAAQSNNGIGISGVCHGAKIMPLKVFTSAGYADFATITQGINYASQNGATVINMSFGSYARSFTMENALLNAYLTSYLVASAGNDRYSIYSKALNNLTTAYPAALPYVLGVQAEEFFSNYDPDGPIYSNFAEHFNYELKAPGGALSTVPGGNYRFMGGTSMAAPIVSGAISLYSAYYPNKTREDLWGDFIHTSSNYINIYSAMFNPIKYPVFDLMESNLMDTISGCDNDGQADAGETIELWLKIRNTFGFADSTYLLLQHTIYGDTNDISILKDSVFIGSLSTYATQNNKLNPFKVHINSYAADDRIIALNVIMKNAGDSLAFIQPVNFKIHNGVELSGIITQDMTLTPDKLWMINNSLRISTGITLTILSGTKLKVNAGVDNKGIINAIGSPDSLIKIEGAISGNINYKYVDLNLKGGGLGFAGKTIENCIIYNGIALSGSKIKDCLIYDFLSLGYGQINIDSIIHCYIKDNIFVISGFMNNCIIDNYILDATYSNISANNCVFTNISNIYAHVYPQWPQYWQQNPKYLFRSDTNFSYKNTFLKNGVGTYYTITNGTENITYFPNQYWGTTDTLKIKMKYYDFWNNAGLPLLNYKPILNGPSELSPACVWKIMVNNKDAQDEYVDPLGVGVHRFDVYFNKEMDINFTPQLSFGVREPYNQQIVSDSGHWDATHKIWTAYKSIQLYTGDGINRLRVQGAKGVGDNWEIPVEDQRFEFIINAAGSSSIDFTATPGLGKVNLEWNNTGMQDLLGFNMYRFQNITDTTFTAPILLNTTLITDTVYTDFNVIPGTHYYYYYKILRTDFAESDSSRIVNAIPVTASQGDANGDLNVNVLDITTIISYMLNQNPQPFIFEAADVNSSSSVDILDLIGVVNLIIGTKSSIGEVIATNPVPAYIYLKPDRIQLNSNAQVAGLQFTLKGSMLKDVKISSLVPGFEFAYSVNDTSITGVLFSFSGKTIPTGMQDILKIETVDAVLNWDNVSGGDKNGAYVKIIKEGDIENLIMDFNLKAYPNPSNGDVNICFNMPEKGRAIFNIYNLYGQLVDVIKDASYEKGSHQLNWHAMKAGIYICRMQITAKNTIKSGFTKDIKLIIIK